MIIAQFGSEHDLDHAASALRAQHAVQIETYMPMEPEADTGRSVLPLVMLCGGIAGAIGGFLMQAYATTISYPENIGGRPDLSWPAYIPTTFELGVLGAVVAGFFGYLIAAGLPHLYDPVDEAERIRSAMIDGYILCVRGGDMAGAKQALSGLSPLGIEEVPG
jgi:H+/Cl- antiporter ClcA